MKNRIVTVFGGSGFIGRHLVRRLAARDAIVRVAVRDREAAAYLKTAGNVGQIVPIAADLTDEATVAAALDGADDAVNLVGILYERGRNRFEAVHHRGAAAIARAAQAAGVRRMVQVSAIGADKYSFSEYGRTKAAGEAAVRDAFPAATVLRPSVVFGPEDNFFNLFGGLTRITPVMPVLGTHQPGGTRFQPVYVGDVADAIVAALTQEAAIGATYELGGPRVYTSRELMELILELTGRKRLLMPVPLGLLSLDAWFLEKMPKPLLTRDQVQQLKTDNVVSEGAKTLADLGIRATAAEAVLPTYLGRYRPGGRRAELRSA